MASLLALFFEGVALGVIFAAGAGAIVATGDAVATGAAATTTGVETGRAGARWAMAPEIAAVLYQ